MILRPFSFSFPSSSFSLSLKTEIPLTHSWYEIKSLSGKGKSTFLKLLMGAHPDFISGNLEGDPSLVSKKESFLYLSQNPFHQIIHTKTKEEFVFPFENFQIRPNIISSHLSSLPKNLSDKKTLHLSHGECQHLLLRSLLPLSPKILFLDEPFSYLDEKTRDSFYTLLLELQKNLSLLVFFIDHTQKLSSLSEKTLFIDNNSVISLYKKEDHKEEFTNLKKELPEIPFVKDFFELRVKNLSFGISSKKEETLLVKNLSFSLHSGQCYTIFAPNGSGKTTFLKRLFQNTFDSSHVFFLKNNKILKNPTSSIGICFQDLDSHFLYPDLFSELKSFNLTLEEIEKYLHLLDIPFSNISPFLLSEGQKRRLSLFYPLWAHRPILLFDEITVGQDPANFSFMKELIGHLKKHQYLILLVSHDKTFFEDISDNVLFW